MTSYLLTGIWCFFTIGIVLLFGKLGQQSLILADAFRLLSGEYDEISSSFKLLDKKSNLAEREASKNIYGVVSNNLRNMAIVEINAFSNGDFSKSSLLFFMERNIALLWQYMAVKEKIPFDSPWFPSEQMYSKWYEASDFQREIAVNYGSGIPPKVIKNSFFIERSICGLNLEGIPHLLKDNNLGYLQHYFKYMGKHLSSGFPLSEYRFIADYISDIQNQWISEWGKNEQGGAVTMIAENIGWLYITYLVGVLKEVHSIVTQEQVTYATSCQRFEDMDFSKALFSNTKECRRFLEQIQIEITVSEKKLTPPWFIRQYHAKFLFEGMEKIKVATYELSVIQMKQLLDELYRRKEYIALAHLLIRLREYHSKWRLLADAIEKVKNQCREFRIDMETNPWTESKVDFGLKWKETADVAADMRIEVLGHLVSEYDSYNQWFQKNVDVLGQLYDMESQWIVDCIAENDIEKFIKAYGKYRNIANSYAHIIGSTIKTAGKNPQWVLNQVCSPVIDFIIVSGYALLWGEVIGDTRWKETIEDATDNKFDLEILANFMIWKYCHVTSTDRKCFEWKEKMENTINKKFADKDACKGCHCIVSKKQERNAILYNCLKGNVSHCHIDTNALIELYPVFVLNQSVPLEKQYKSRWNWGQENAKS